MPDKPIIFSGPMVRALLDKRKTQTRRVLKPQPPGWCANDRRPGYSWATPPGHIAFRGRYVDGTGEDHGLAAKFIPLPYARGDRLYVREAWRVEEGFDGRPPCALPIGEIVGRQYEADAERRFWRRPHLNPGRYRHARHMPRRFSRLTLTVTDVRVQRLQEISEEDARAEGVERASRGMQVEWRDYQGIMDTAPGPRSSFCTLWNSLHGPDAWAANPWVVALTFTVERRNIDEGRNA